MFAQFYIEDYFRPGRAGILMPYTKRMAFLLRWVDTTRYFAHGSKAITLFDLINEGILNDMPRTKQRPAGPKSGRPSRFDKQPETSLTWCNVTLSQDDIQVLERSDTTFEHLGAMLLGVADEGFSFSVKRMDDGESIMCAIYGAAVDNPTRQMGLSSFAADTRDAVLCCMYKFDQLCGREFRSNMGSDAGQRKRFR